MLNFFFKKILNEIKIILSYLSFQAYNTYIYNFLIIFIFTLMVL